jgi:endonuclease-3 related protein
MKRANPTAVYETLFKAFGPQDWWLGETQLEVIIGAVLTQNTAWQNVERAIENLKEAGLLDLQALHDVQQFRLTELIRPSGYFNIKGKRLKAMVDFLSENGGIENLAEGSAKDLRNALLEINGVGEETADSILLYAFDRPVFVVDAYTKRIFHRLGLLEENTGYREVQEFFENRLPRDSALFNEYHALIVRLGKEVCKKTRPLCGKCPINELCEFQANL